MLSSLFNHLPLPPAPPIRVRLRERRHACRVSYLRYPGKGTRIQVRWWIGGYGSINCGLYDSEQSAELVRGELVKETARHPTTPLGLWKALLCVLDRIGNRIGEFTTPLPMWVRPLAQGGFIARVTKCGKEFICEGPFVTPDEAHLAMAVRLASEFPTVARGATAKRVQNTLTDHFAVA